MLRVVSFDSLLHGIAFLNRVTGAHALRQPLVEAGLKEFFPVTIVDDDILAFDAGSLQARDDFAHHRRVRDHVRRTYGVYFNSHHVPRFEEAPPGIGPAVCACQFLHAEAHHPAHRLSLVMARDQHSRVLNRYHSSLIKPRHPQVARLAFRFSTCSAGERLGASGCDRQGSPTNRFQTLSTGERHNSLLSTRLFYHRNSGLTTQPALRGTGSAGREPNPSSRARAFARGLTINQAARHRHGSLQLPDLLPLLTDRASSRLSGLDSGDNLPSNG